MHSKAKIFYKAVLEKLYIVELKNRIEVAETFDCNTPTSIII